MTTNSKTPAMALQEFTVRKKLAPPEYDLIVCNNGTHENEFQFKVNVASIQAVGIGRSKQVARHDAAYKAIKLLTENGMYDMENTLLIDFNPHLHRNEPDQRCQGGVNSIGTLQDLCIENKLPQPSFIEISDVGPPHCRQFTYECRLASLRTQATANTKKQAKQISARQMLEKIKDIIPEVAAEMENAILPGNDEDVLKKYGELNFFSVISDKTVRIKDFGHCFVSIIQERNVPVENIKKLIRMHTEESLKRILEELDLQFQFLIFQEAPSAAVMLNVNSDTPFCILGSGSTVEEAKANALEEIFENFDYYLRTINK